MAFNRKSKTSSSAAADPVEVLDSNEQEAIIADLEKEALESEAATRRTFRMVFRFLAAIFLVIFFISTYQQEMSMGHQWVFKDVVPHLGFQIFYILSALNFFIFSNFIKDKSPALPGWAWNIALLSTFSIMVFWCYIFYNNNVTNYVLYWLPFSSIGGYLLALWVDREFNTVRNSVENLNQSRYQFNKP